MEKMNCWEFKKCGREPGGRNEVAMGACPAARERRLDGVHEGRQGGRACWVVAGSMCEGRIQGTFAQKFETCSKCDFYQTVRGEERGGFTFSAVLLEKLRSIGDHSTVPAGGGHLTAAKWWRGSQLA